MEFFFFVCLFFASNHDFFQPLDWMSTSATEKFPVIREWLRV